MSINPLELDLPPANATDTPATDPAAIERRLERNLPLVAVVMIGATAVKVDWMMAASVTVGCALAVMNYRWMHRSLRAIIQTTTEKPSPWQMSKFLFRWVLIAGVMFLFPRAFQLSTGGILFGLFSLPAAVMLEAGFQVLWILRHGVK
ncbi:MAG: ATP synthase subunit I [Blastocatellia bacterium]|nr:ATP synthase subunit I [Blastocatellia bacterium]